MMGYVWAFIAGSMLGSFLNVVIERMPLGQSVVRGRARCGACGTILRGRDLVPIWSWLRVGGRCRTCGAAIPLRDPLVELAMGILAMLCAAVCGFNGRALAVFLAAALLLAIAVIDWATMLIDDRLILWLIPVALWVVAASPEPGWGARVLGIGAVSLPMYLLTLVVPGGFGDGDIRLMLVCGFLLGWQQALLAGFLAVMLGGGYGAYLLMTHKAERHSHFAFAPFLAVGVISALLWGEALLAWYGHL